MPYPDDVAHEHAYVRSSCAYALAQAVAAWPQSAANVISSLQDLFRDKAIILSIGNEIRFIDMFSTG
jgi:hypothetical protein